MGMLAGVAFVVTLSAGLQGLDCRDPWSGAGLVPDAGYVRKQLDRVDPWTNRAIAVETARLRVDVLDPWTIAF